MTYPLMISFSLLLFVAASFITIPAIINHNHPRVTTSAALLCAMTIVISLTCYHLWGNGDGLKRWQAGGEKHYQLMVEVQRLGGIEGIIADIQKRLQTKPDDAQGWYLLGRLYLSMGNHSEALAALKRAHDLAPTDRKITRAYRQSQQA